MAPVPRSCFCCNVKVGTIALAFLVMMLGIGGIVLVSYAFSHPDVLYFSEIAVDSANQTLDVFYFFENSASVKWMSLAVSILVTLVGCFAIVGVATNKPGHITPLIVLLMLIILRSFLSLCNVIFNWSSIRLSIAVSHSFPKEVQTWLLSLNDQALAAIIYGMFFVGFVVKFYLFSMTYSCYSHIRSEQKQAGSSDEEAPEAGTKRDVLYQDKLPEYNDIHKFPLADDGVKPPPYSA